MKDYDFDHTGSLTFEEFESWLATRETELHTAFNVYDRNHDGKIELKCVPPYLPAGAQTRSGVLGHLGGGWREVSRAWKSVAG